MKTAIAGGNIIQSWGNQISHSDCLFSSSPYTYSTLHLKNAKSALDHQSCLIYFYSGEEATISGNDTTYKLSPGDALFSDQVSLELSSSLGQFFIVSGNASSNKFCHHVSKDQLKVVTKPWGKEIWINHPLQNFSLKEIHINAGTKTSLQYHQYKTETNLIFQGTSKLYFKSNPQKQNDAITADDLGEMILNQGDVMHVTPNHIHRLEAMTELILLEASTNHLDDVIRIQDDFKRTHGRIESEHEKT